MKTKKFKELIVVGLLILSLGGCTLSQAGSSESSSEVETQQIAEVMENVVEDSASTDVTSTIVSTSENTMLDLAEMFSDRDLEQEADLTDAIYIDLKSHENNIIDNEGVYVVKGDVTNATIIIDADDKAKVQIVFDGVTIMNDESPAVYVKSADKVFITTTDSENHLEVIGEFVADGDTNLDAVIFSKSDLVLNGAGEITIISNNGNGISSKDDLKVTGGTYNIASLEDSIEANDSIRIYDGTFSITTNKDGLHSENDEDKSLGYIYIQNGKFVIKAVDDAIHGNSIVQIDGGNINIITSSEGIEGTYIMINGGTIDIYATDDGINATSLSNYDVMIEVNGGDITIGMASGDTDGFDANGDIVINGGNIDVTGGSTFDADGSAVLNGGTVIVNGETVSELPKSHMGRGKH